MVLKGASNIGEQNLMLGDTVLCWHCKLSVYHANWTSNSSRRADGLRWNTPPTLALPLWVLFRDQLEEVGWEGGSGWCLCPRLKPRCFGTRDPLLPSSLPTSTAAKFRWGENYAGRYFSKLCVNSEACQTKLHLHLFLYLIAHLNKLEGWWERRKNGKGVGGGKVRRQGRGSGWGFAKINAWMLSLTDWHLWSEL